VKNLTGVSHQDSMFRKKDLEQIDEILYTANKEELVARAIINVDDDNHPAVETVGYDTLSESGAAKVTANGATDIPLVDGDIERGAQKVVTIESGFKITSQEKRAAEMLGRDIDTNKAAIARRVMAEKENSIVFEGDAELDIPGLVNAANINTLDVDTDSDSDGVEWEYKTGFEIIKDIREARKKVSKRPGFIPNVLVLPPDQYERLQDPINETNVNTVMSYLENMGWFDEIVSTSSLEGADPDGDNDCGIILDNNPAYIELALPLDIYRHEEIKMDNNDIRINLEERFAGALIRYPLAVCRFDGI
jgi:hypothetical protein